MKKIKGIYNGYELNDGRKFRLAEVGNNNYKVGTMDENGNWCMADIRFTRVRNYKNYLKLLEDNEV